MIIGITGTDGVGKGTVVDYLVREKGFTHFSSRTLIVAEIEKRGLAVDRNQMRLMGNELRAMFGDDVIVQKAFEQIRTEGVENAVIESIRALAEANTLKAHGALLLAVDADPKIRYERVQGRRSASDKVSYEQFLAHEELEKNDHDPHGMQKAAVMEMADYTIMNNRGFGELKTGIESFLNTYEGK